MKNEILKLHQEQGPEAALAYLRKQEDVPAALQAWGELARSIYNKQHDVALMISVFQQAIAHGKAVAEDVSDTEYKFEIQSLIKGLYYDLGVNTWPGWGDEGIRISPEEMAIGYQAAQDNLMWADILRKPYIPLGRAYWLFAAHQLAAREYPGACDNFGKAAKLARLGGAEGEALLSEGFYAITRILCEEDAYISLDTIKINLQALEHGPFFISQLETALAIFK